MHADPALSDWLRLTLIPGIGGETQRRLLSTFGSPGEIFSAGRTTLRSLLGHRLADLLLDADNSDSVASALRWAQGDDHTLIALGTPEYPPALLEIPDPPTVLYAKGRCDLLALPAFSIVGSRNPTPQGTQNAECFADALARAGWVITSGLALGIDAAAHRATLNVGGATIAFVGTGVDRIYPSRNRDLAHRICDQGCIVSEFPLGTPAIASNFPRRNRLISGIARGTLIVEAAIESGSLITARLAAEQGRDVFAIPGSIHSPQSRGCHKLIKQGAKLVETVQDILDEFAWQAPSEPLDDPMLAVAEPTADKLLEDIGFDPCSIDALVERSGLPIEMLSARLLQLELSGHLALIPGGGVQRLRRN